MRLTIVTGLSGAGRSTALKALEDLEFFCADNIPPKLIPQFARICKENRSAQDNIAVVADMRMGDMFDDIFDAIEEIKKMDNMDCDILFLDATDDVIVRRFKQTRRRHPLSGSGKIISGIMMERDRLQRIKDMSDVIIDTSIYSTRQLKEILEKRYFADSDSRLRISVITFGYKRGIPIDADMVFDMRFLPNPFYKEELRQLSGLTKEVSEYVLGFPAAEHFLKNIAGLVEYLVPLYVEQDKKQLVIAIGCTGGMHRSVATGEELYARLLENGLRVTLEHRDLYLEDDSIKQRFGSETKGV